MRRALCHSGSVTYDPGRRVGDRVRSGGRERSDPGDQYRGRERSDPGNEYRGRERSDPGYQRSGPGGAPPRVRQYDDSDRIPVRRDDMREPLRAQRDPLAEDHGRPRANRDEHQQWRKQTWLGRFVSTYGWRAYALPILAVVTCVVLYQTVTGTGAPSPVSAEGPVQGPPTIDA